MNELFWVFSGPLDRETKAVTFKMLSFVLFIKGKMELRRIYRCPPAPVQAGKIPFAILN